MKVRNGLIAVFLVFPLVAVLILSVQPTVCSEAIERGEQEREVAMADLPAPVKAIILDEAGSNKITEIEEISRGNVKIYEAEWLEGDKEVEIEVVYFCKLVRKSIEPAEAEGEEDDDGEEDGDEDESEISVIKEREVSFNQLPAPVQQALQKKAGKNRIEEIEEIYTNKGLFYESEWIDGDWAIEIVFTAKGELFCMEMELICDDDDDEDDDDEDDDEDEDEEDEDEDDDEDDD